MGAAPQIPCWSSSHRKRLCHASGAHQPNRLPGESRDPLFRLKNVEGGVPAGKPIEDAVGWVERSETHRLRRRKCLGGLGFANPAYETEAIGGRIRIPA